MTHSNNSHLNHNYNRPDCWKATAAVVIPHNERGALLPAAHGEWLKRWSARSMEGPILSIVFNNGPNCHMQQEDRREGAQMLLTRLSRRGAQGLLKPFFLFFHSLNGKWAWAPASYYSALFAHPSHFSVVYVCRVCVFAFFSSPSLLSF